MVVQFKQKQKRLLIYNSTISPNRITHATYELKRWSRSIYQSCQLCRLAFIPPRKIPTVCFGTASERRHGGSISILLCLLPLLSRPRLLFPSGVQWRVVREMLPGSLLSSQSDPSPSPSDDDGAHAVLDAAGEKMLVGNGLWPEYSQDSPNVLGMVNRQFFQVAVTHPPAFCMNRIFSRILRRVEGTQLLYSLILVLYWDFTSHIV